MPSAFLSYSRDDGPFVAELEKRLQSAGWSVWRDEHSLRAGDRWPRRLGDAVTACEVFVLIWSAHAASSDFVELEWTIAVAAKRQICIVWLDGQSLPATLTPYQAHQTSEPDSAFEWLTGSFTAQDIPVEAAEPVLRTLDAAPAAEPSQLTAALKAAFVQPGCLAGTLHIVLNKGQEQDWFASTWIAWFSIISVVAFSMLIVRELRTSEPIV